MPELPEVEVTRRRLDAWTKGRAIVRARVPKSRVIGKQSPKKVMQFLAGRRIEAIERRGKSMLMQLSGAGALHLHLGMTGRFLLGHGNARHVRLELELDDEARVLFDDPRMFGRVAVGPWDELEERFFDTLGPDPLRDEFTAVQLLEILERTRRPIKIALMDQAKIAGIGNIYASEALWRAKIDPLEEARTVDRARVKKLHAAIRSTMHAAIERLEAGEKYLSEGGENHFQVYGRERCPRCRGPIDRYELGGRSTYWCKRCQRGP